MAAGDVCPRCNGLHYGDLCPTGSLFASHPVPPTGYFQGIPPEQPTRRERIATAALQGLLAGDTPNGETRDGQDWRVADYANDPNDAAETAVALADALIAQLDKEEE